MFITYNFRVLCSGILRPSKVKTAFLSGRTIVGSLLVALLPNDIGKSMTLIIKKNYIGKCRGKVKKGVLKY